MKTSIWFFYAFLILGFISLNFLLTKNLEKKKGLFDSNLNSGKTYQYYVRMDEQEDSLNVYADRIKEITRE